MAKLIKAVRTKCDGAAWTSSLKVEVTAEEARAIGDALKLLKSTCAKDKGNKKFVAGLERFFRDSNIEWMEFIED